ncbi:MAG: hypothetical protein WBW35_21450, partial [Xanthobacteraceae bacterium]
ELRTTGGVRLIAFAGPVGKTFGVVGRCLLLFDFGCRRAPDKQKGEDPNSDPSAIEHDDTR